MLSRFLIDNRQEIIRRTRAKVASRAAPRATEAELTNGVPLFLSQLVAILQREEAGEDEKQTEMTSTAARHGGDLLRKGFSVAQVVHDYGDVCQAVTELALEQREPISNQDFRTLNRCLDNAIAEAVTEYGRQREQDLSALEVERLGILAHELRNLITSATLSYQMLRRGDVPVGGSTGALLGRCLTNLRETISRSLAEVRLLSGTQTKVRIRLFDLIEEAEVSATMDAKARQLRFSAAPVEHDLEIEADRMSIASALSNLLHNAFKFTRPGSEVALRVRRQGERVLIEVEDACGGLPPGAGPTLFERYRQAGADKSGLGLGLTIARRAVETNGGTIEVRDLPGKGCVFTIGLPLAPPLSAPAPESLH